MSLDTASFILGGLFIAVAILGGGFEVKEVKIQSVGRTNRILSLFAGIFLIFLSVALNKPEIVASIETNKAKLVKADEESLNMSEFQREFDKKYREGYYPDSISAQCDKGVEKFHAHWKERSLGLSIYSQSAWTKEDFDKKSVELVAQGYTIAFENTFTDCAGRIRYQATWTKVN